MSPRPSAYDPTVLTDGDSPAVEDAPEAISAPDPLIGAVVNGAYEIRRCIGEGGMARVYEASHRRIPSKRVAIKVLNADLARVPEIAARFEREAQAAAQIDHPGVVAVQDVGRAPDGRPFIAYEHLEGADLGELVRREGRLDFAAAVRIVRQAADALGAAHGRGVIHRDVKPENLFVSGPAGARRVKVLDFGISKMDEAFGASLTQTGAVLGTPAYMSPEQARGEKVDHRTDVYSLGAVLYRLATGARPFEEVEAAATIGALLTSAPTRPRAVDPSVPEALELVIQRAMAERPDDRFGTMAELGAALAPFDGGEVAADRASCEAELQRSSREIRAARPKIALTAALAASCLVLALADLAAAGLRRFKGADLTSLESALVLIGVVAAVATPIVLFLRKALRGFWSNAARAVDLSRALRVALLVALAAYGLASLAVRFASAFVLHRAATAVGPAGSAILLAVALGAGIATAAWLRRRGR
jgi:tRNA A-37 threonylcarbamoyl transferase component Bud32